MTTRSALLPTSCREERQGPNHAAIAERAKPDINVTQGTARCAPVRRRTVRMLQLIIARLWYLDIIHECSVGRFEVDNVRTDRQAALASISATEASTGQAGRRT